MSISMQVAKSTFVSKIMSCNISTSNSELSACESYHIPPHVAPHVDFVTPTVHFNVIVSRSPEASYRKIDASGTPINTNMQGRPFNSPMTTGSTSEIFNQLDDCDQLITPLCLRALYGLDYKPRATSNNSFAVGC
jgi:tripeptidyl-peptidase-1